MLTNKSDVYAFGIVMMEILTAQSHFAITRKVSNNDSFPLEKFSFPFECVERKNTIYKLTIGNVYIF
jgi:hypothetical protein